MWSLIHESHEGARALALSVGVLTAVLPGMSGVAHAQTRTYSQTADFQSGSISNLNTNVADQLTLNAELTAPFPFINVAASTRGTVVRINTLTGEVVGEYFTSPAVAAGSPPRNPSRTTVDRLGNVWCGNRTPGAGNSGSVVKIGIVTGGTRGRKELDGGFVADPLGEYLQGPFLYNTCVDRDGDGLIRTSRGLGNILPWPVGTDIDGSAALDGSALVRDALDEGILVYQTLPGAPITRHVAVDRDNSIWAGGYNNPNTLYKLNNADGALATR